jgi:hypothetical protein
VARWTVLNSACYYVTAYYYEIQKRPVNEELTDLDGFSHNSPVSRLLSPTDTEQTKPVITSVTLNKIIKLLGIRPCMFKNVNYIGTEISFPRPHSLNLQ